MRGGNGLRVATGVVLLGFCLGPLHGASLEERDYAFQAEAVDGRHVRIGTSETSQWTVICFVGTECPLARLYGPRLERLADELADAPVTIVGVMSNRQDAKQEIRDFAAQHGVSFPLVKDVDNVLADQYGAERTPEVFVLDRRLQVRYHGRIDDQYLPGVARQQPQREDLWEALQELLAGKPVTVPSTEPQGCLIGRVKRAVGDEGVTYCNQIARLLNEACVECHREGEIGPFALMDYDEVVGWGDMMWEVVEQGRMPPWHADPKFGHFQNARQLTDEQKQQLRTWVEAGMPYGDASQLPEPPTFVSGWQLPRQPDLVLAMRDRPYTVPAEGTVEYQYFVVDPGFTEDRWVTAAQVIPGNAAVVHHSIVFVRPPDGGRFRGVGWLGAYVPGQRPFVLPPGRARLVPAGSKLVFQQHYTPNGREARDITQIGLLFCDESQVTHEAFTLLGIDQEFEIPPRDSNFQVQGTVRWFPPQGELLAIMPHMHLRGKAFRFEAERIGQHETLLHVPQYDFNWQHVYELANPVSLENVDELKFTVTFDNSAQNLVNPDPDQFVTWGDQTWEEMAVAFFEVAEPRHVSADRPRPRSIRADQTSASAENDAADATQHAQFEREQRIARFLTDFYARFDQNGDKIIDRDETPLSFRRFGFRQFDSDGNQRLTRDEVDAAARQRL